MTRRTGCEDEIKPEVSDLPANVHRSRHAPMDIVYEQGIWVTTYLFPESKYDILITSSAKADFYSLKHEINLLLE